MGYYVVWERCCRNEVITNILNPGAVGQAFYLEFPAIVKDDKPFINSSPILFPPLSDYACVNNYYYVDFSGWDPDGDSLVYSIAQPLRGYSSPAANNIVPPPRPAPYPVVQWTSGISTRASVPGNPPLSISKDGLLTVVPSETGLFVFSVQCEEYRDGIKIGEVRRDFQMLVIECPDPGIQPELVVKVPGSTVYTDAPDTMVFTSDEKKCYQFSVRDRDGAENLKFRVKPVNFTADLSGSLSVTEAPLEDPADSVTFEFCFPDCPFLPGQPHIVDIIAGDNACPLPLQDSVRLVVYIESPPNNPAEFDTLANVLDYDIREGEIVDFNLKGSDGDGDSLSFYVVSQGFDTHDFNMNFDPSYPVPNLMDLNFIWDSSCRIYDFNEKQDFNLLLLLDDRDYCGIFNPDTIELDIHVGLPPNTPPVISSDAISNPVEMQILDSIFINISASDPDGDSIHVYAIPEGFDLETKGFTSFEYTSREPLTESFGWILGCETLDPEDQDELLIHFVVEDSDKCKITNADTLSLEFNALLPENNKPGLTLLNHDSPLIDVIAGDSLKIDIKGTDMDADSIFISLADPANSIEATGAIFSPVRGIGEIFTTFSWITDCGHLQPGMEFTNYNYRLIIRDNKCLLPESDTLDLIITVRNREVNYEDVFIPNVFTPNSDGFNEYFTVLDLPEDNCDNQFQSVSIYNRFGKEVFFTNQKEFRWYARNVKNGIYYYHIKYSRKEYNGYLHVFY
jgi:gliding motility-associated-like protein